jgi:hypothetical protein
MNVALVRLAIRIRDELIDLEVVLKRVAGGWKRYSQSTDDHFPSTLPSPFGDYAVAGQAWMVSR